MRGLDAVSLEEANAFFASRRFISLSRPASGLILCRSCVPTGPQEIEHPWKARPLRELPKSWLPPTRS